jgi:hypothetical protein
MNLPTQPKRLAVVQSNYIPWKGYFDLINAVDEFVLYDDMQYTTNDWRNRNLIKTPSGAHWLTIPVATKGRFGQPIREVRTAGSIWRRKHWNAILLSYGKSTHFERYRGEFESLYLDRDDELLSTINLGFLQAACRALGIKTRITFSMAYTLEGDRNQRLIGLCDQIGATKYVSGPAASVYLDEARFASAGIEVTYFDYSGYPTYKQRFGDFTHHVSVLDLIFNEGPDAPRFMKSFSVR